MPTNECKRKDCKNFGIDLCIKSRVRHDENGMCIDYEINEPQTIRVRESDLNASFNSNCEKDRGIYRTSKVTRVLK